MKSNNTNYTESGVNIDEGNRFISLIKDSVSSTNIPGVIGGIGGFAGLFSLAEFKDMDEPVLVSGADGVGTKLKVALMTNSFNTIGIDLVAMSVNDLLVTGAVPLFFLDYVAVGKLIPEKMKDVIHGVSYGCKQAECALLGGETAEMPGIYQNEDFDLAGFAVGIVDRKNIIDGSNIKEGNTIIGVASSGFHSNGYSLLRHVLFNNKKFTVDSIFYDNVTVGEALLIPTKIYTQVVKKVTKSINVLGMAHITGGGFYDNIPRVLPKNISAEINISQIELPRVIHEFIKIADIEKQELYRVFNMGIGYIFVIDEKDTQLALDTIASCGEKGFVLGKTIQGDNSIKIKGIDFD